MNISNAHSSLFGPTYYRLIKETPTQIFIDPKGLETPGVECIQLQKTQKRLFHTLHNYYDVYSITFENDRVILATLDKTSAYVLNKIPLIDQLKPSL